MKPSARVREQAAVICAIEASTPGLSGVTHLYLDAPEIAHDLAFAAWMTALKHLNAAYPGDEYPPVSIVSAEAEALLRTGEFP